MADMINHPRHYQAANDPEGVYETIRVLAAEVGWPEDKTCREREECWAKLLRLGLAKEAS